MIGANGLCWVGDRLLLLRLCSCCCSGGLLGGGSPIGLVLERCDCGVVRGNARRVELDRSELPVLLRKRQHQIGALQCATKAWEADATRVDVERARRVSRVPDATTPLRRADMAL